MKHFFPILILVILIVGLFSPSRNFSFVDYDDQEYVIENAHMRDGLSWENIKWAFSSVGYADNWHPLAWISMMVDVSLAGPVDDETWEKRDNRVAKVMHAHNVFLHAANAGLLFLLLWIMLKRTSTGNPSYLLCLFLALAWAIHPLRCEVVCWVSERKELTSVFFMLLSLIAYLYPARSPMGSRVEYGVSFLAFLCAILAKPVAVTLPVVIFAYDWVFGGRPKWLKILPYWVCSAGCCLLTMCSQTTALKSGADQFVCQRLQSIFVSPLIYLRQTVWPSGLSSFYKLTFEMDWLGVASGVLLVVAMVAICIYWLGHRSSWISIAVFGIAWIYVGLLPMIGIVKVGPQEHADRYTYWIGCGMCAVLALAIQKLLDLGPFRKFVDQQTSKVLSVSCCTIVLLGYLTCGRCAVWRNTITLFRDSQPKSWYGENAGILAKQLEATGNPDAIREAEMWLRETVAYRASTAACAELALFLTHRPQMKSLTNDDDPYAEARYLAHKSIAGWAQQSTAWEALGNCDAGVKNWKSAIENYEKALPYSRRTDLIKKKIEICREKLAAEGKEG